MISGNTALAQNTTATGFDKLKSLAGEWEAVGPDGAPVKISYEIISGGAAVMETRAPANEPSMVSIFHLDGDKLVMTHYCSAGNQPHMQADPHMQAERMQTEIQRGEIKALNFSFVSITNLSKPADGHMRKLSYTFRDKDHITQVWTWREAGKDAAATFDLVRKR
jgi:hypothetical protein